jgi:hypothetical protein
LRLHARVEGVGPSALDDPSLAQLRGPRYSTEILDRIELERVREALEARIPHA